MLRLADLQLFVFNLNTKTYTRVTVDNTKYTISSIHVNPADSGLYTVTPGLYGNDGPWSLVRINPSDGSITAGPTVAPKGQFINSYNGAVYGSGVTVDGEVCIAIVVV
jgi:hypothetical protein